MWCHRIPRQHLAPFPNPTGVGEGFRTLLLTHPLTHRMQVLEAVLHWGHHAAQSGWPLSESDSPLRQSKIRSLRSRETPKMELLAHRRGLHWGQHATQGWPASLSNSPLQAPSSIVITNVTQRKSTLPRTANSHRRSETLILQPVTKVDMTTVNPSAETQPMTSAPPSVPRRSGNSF
jgi:hypothetical protein